jgi:alcohol dehydrogenase class IV
MTPRVIDFWVPTSILLGSGASRQVGSELAERGVRRPLLVTDAGVRAAGLVEPVLAAMEASCLKVTVFDRVEAEPDIAVAEAAAAAAKGSSADAVVGLGGGSSLDVAKCAAMAPGNEAHLEAYFGIGKVPGKGLPLVLLPTTAGTGSEVSPIAVLTDPRDHLKKGIVSPHLLADVAIVDPNLALGLPPPITAYTGIDTLCHAVEAFTNRRADPFIDVFAREAIRLCGLHLRRATTAGWDLAARTGMARAALFGGMTLDTVGCAIIHACAYGLGGRYPVPHGLANSLFLPHGMAFNLPTNLERFGEVAVLLGERTEGLSVRSAAERSVEAVTQLIRDLNLPSRLREVGVEESSLPEMARGAAAVTRLLDQNPRAATEADLLAIFCAAY